MTTTILVHGYSSSGAIEATIEGVELMIPDDMANRHRQMIANWEAEGNAIPPYVAPALEVEAAVDPVDKLAAFLNANPDVKALLGA